MSAPAESSGLTYEALLEEHMHLRARCDEAEETLRALRNGEVDAIVVGTKLYSLDSAVEESNRLRGTALDQIHEAVIAADAESRITYLNPAAERMYGVTAAAVLGCTLDTVYHARWRDPGDEGVKNSALRTSGHWHGEKVHVKATGGELYVEASVSKLMNADGEPAGTLMVIRDATDRRRAEDELRESASRQQVILDGLTEGLTITDIEGRIVLMNQAAMTIFGFANEEDYRRDLPDFAKIFELSYPDGRPMPLDEWPSARVLNGEALNGYEVWAHRIDTGARFCASFNGALVRDDDGTPLQSVVSFRDITEQKHADAVARAADRRKDEFLAMLAHELRNPLAPMRNAIELMRLSATRGGIDDARHMITRQLDQMVRLVDDLLDVSRITHGRVELRKERVDIASIVRNAIETSRPLLEAAGHNLTVNLPPSAIFVEGDATRLAQILVNLLNNAAKYTPAHGYIVLGVAPRDDQVVITVSDNGIGIPADMLSSVFDLFTQVGGALNRSQGGLGIGLTLVRRLVEMHHGSVEVRSGGAGLGSEFIVRLPQAPAAPIADKPHTTITMSARKAGGCRVLVVDDNRDANDSLAALLRLTGHATASAYDGLAAIKTAEEFRPDAVLLDIGLPGLNGYEVAQRMRTEEWGKSIVLIALTGWGSEDDRRRSHDAGFDHHVVKPVHPLELEKLLGPLRASE